MGNLDRKLPDEFRLEIDPRFCDEENAIRRFVNGDTDIHGFIEDIKVVDRYDKNNILSYSN